MFTTQFSECEAKLEVNVLFLKISHSKLCIALNKDDTYLLRRNAESFNCRSIKITQKIVIL
jgi:hypothetical protein